MRSDYLKTHMIQHEKEKYEKDGWKKFKIIAEDLLDVTKKH